MAVNCYTGVRVARGNLARRFGRCEGLVIAGVTKSYRWV